MLFLFLTTISLLSLSMAAGLKNTIQYSSSVPRIAYLRHNDNAKSENGDKTSVGYLPGFQSNMMGRKGDFLQVYCQEQSLEFVRFDYRAHGQSEGHLGDATISTWLEDTLWILDNVVRSDHKAILVGSSMGGWLSLLIAQRRPHRISGLVLLACAVDMTRYYPPQHYRQEMQLTAQTDEKGRTYYTVPNLYDDQEPYLVYESLLQDGEQYCLLDDPSIDLGNNIPVQIIHGEKDVDVPPERSKLLLEKLLASSSSHNMDATLHLIEDGDHRLSEPQHLELLRQVLDEMLARMFRG